MNNMSRYSLVVLVVLGATGPAAASSWADAMFESLSRDFGSVPRGPTLTHAFRFVNNTGAPVRITGVRVSCGCLSAQPQQYNVPAGQESTIIARMDTTRFQNSKNVTIFVTFDQPKFDEVRLWVQANSRDDFTILPESLALGKIKRGSPASASVQVSFLGSGQYQVKEVTAETNYIQPAIKEVRRNATEATYELTAKIREDAPPGKWYTDVWLHTNNPSIPKVRVPLTVEIEATLSVSPENVGLGQVKVGAVAERKVIVHGAAPFQIKEIQGTDKELTVRDTTTGSKTVHVLTVTYRPTRAGELNRTLRIVTDLKTENTIEFTTRAQVAP
jgi:hypothetical protein